MPKGVYERSQQASTNQMTADAVSESPRAAETRRERRRRNVGDLDVMARMKLAIPQEIKEREERAGKTLRWVRDDPGRLQQMIADDWDRVPDVDSVSASRTDEGQLVLMSKYGDWYDEDRSALRETNRTLEKQAVSGKSGTSEVDDKGFYTPEGATNRISHGG